MKRILLILVALFFFSTLVLGGLLDLLKERLSQDALYLQALKFLNQAQQRLKKDEEWFTSYFDLDTYAGLSGEEFRIRVYPRLSFYKNDWDIYISSDLYVYPQSADWYGSIGVTLSKDLFRSEKIEDLENQASYLSALWSVKNGRNRVFKILASEIFNSWIARQKLQLFREELEIRQRIYEKEIHRPDNTVSEEELNAAQKTLLTLEGSSVDLERQLLGRVEVDEPLLEETVKVLEELVGMQMEEESQREDIKALELHLKAAEEEKNRSFLQYWPTPSLSIGWYGGKSGYRSFSIGLGLYWYLLDRGERDMTAKNADLNYQIALASYQRTRDCLENQQQSLEMKIAYLETSQKIAEIDLEMAQTDLEKARRQFKKGLITEDELRLAEIETMKRELDVKQKCFDILITQLELQILHGVDLIALLGVEG